ncbi:hypothetical protein D3C87_2189270 [compost metagenome]
MFVVLDDALDAKNPHVTGGVEPQPFLGKSMNRITLQLRQITAIDQCTPGFKGQTGVITDILHCGAGQH